MYLQCNNGGDMRKAIQKFGNSQGVTIPKPMLEQMGLAMNDEIDMRLEGDTLMLTKAKGSRRYSAKELNAQCDFSAQMPDDLVAFAVAPAVGSEAI